LEIQEITKVRHKPHFNTLAGVWRRYIRDRYFIGYNHYINNILTEGNLKGRIAELEEGIKKHGGRQMSFWDDLNLTINEKECKTLFLCF
jgi:hypothetical protein